MKNDDDNDEKCCIELDFKITKKEAIYENTEQRTEQLDEENSFNIINKRLINIIINKMKNKENGIAFSNRLMKKIFRKLLFPNF